VLDLDLEYQGINNLDHQPHIKTLTLPFGVFLSQIGRQLISLLKLEEYLEKRERQENNKRKQERGKQTSKPSKTLIPTS
jgi:hypothetical protein